MHKKKIIQTLLAGNDYYVDNHAKKYFEIFKNAQNPVATLVACADARVQTDIFGLDPINQLFVVRNIGNQLMPVFGSVDYGILHLKTPLLIILGHTHCGAINAVLNDYEEEPFDIISELDHLSIPIRHIKHAYDGTEDTWMSAVEQNVDYQVKLAVKKYEKQIAEQMLTVVGIVHDFTGFYDSGEGRLLIINVNGNNSTSTFWSDPLFDDVDDHLKNEHIRRFTQN